MSSPRLYQLVKVCFGLIIFSYYAGITNDLIMDWNNTLSHWEFSFIPKMHQQPGDALIVAFRWNKLYLTMLSTAISFIISTGLRAAKIPWELWYPYAVIGLSTTCVTILSLLDNFQCKQSIIQISVIVMCSIFGYKVHMMQQKEQKALYGENYVD